MAAVTVARARRLHRLTRQVPGLRRLRRWVAQRLRGSQLVRAQVKRVYAVDTASPVPMDVAPGRVLGGVGTEALPVALVVITGADTGTIEQAIDEIARLQRMSAGFRPVIVTDRPVFSAIRRYGFPAELLLPCDDWDPTDQGTTWDEYARRRLALLIATYRATASVVLGPAGVDDRARLLLDSLRPAVH